MSNEDFDTSMGDAFRQRHSIKPKGSSEPVKPHFKLQKFDSGNPAPPPSLLDIQAEEERLSRQSREQFKPRQLHSGSHSIISSHSLTTLPRSGPNVVKPTISHNASTYSGQDNFDRRTDRRAGDGRTSSRRRGEVDPSQLPLEQGCVCSLKDGFGFIYCADREEELFFHFSEVRNCHPLDLALDDELEFRVGNDRSSDKLRASEVHRLDQGSVVWEVEDDPGVRVQGLVKKPARTDRNGNVTQDGIIQVLEKPFDEMQTEEDEVAATTGSFILFSPNDLQTVDDEQSSDNAYSMDNRREYRRGNSNSSNPCRPADGGNRLCINDLVEFAVVTSRRTKKKHARLIRLLQSDRDRQLALKEAALLAKAPVEHGIVTSLKSDFGFLRSNKRKEEVFFHYSNVLLHDDDMEEYELKVGNEMSFSVICDDSGGSGRKPRVCARNIRILPSGTVKFETVVAEGVLGIVTQCPQPADSSHSYDVPGIVRLLDCIKDVDDDGNERVVSEVGFNSQDSPGGTFSLREGTIGLWVRDGDTLLFDVVKQTIDGALRIFPTKKQIGDGVAEENEAPSVKLVSCATALRHEGTVHMIKDEYGFIKLAERATETYFRLYEQFPEGIQRDLLRGMGIKDQPVLEMVAHAEVHFDLSIQPELRTKSRSQRSGAAQQESLKARRILLVPPGTVLQTKVLAEGVTGVVEKEDPKQPYAGMIELTTEVSCMTFEERHPLVAKLVRSILDQSNTGPKSFIFPEVQSAKEDDVVMDLVESIGNGLLRCSHLPMSGQRKNGGRLCITRVDENERPDRSDVLGSLETIDPSFNNLVDIDEPKDKGKKKEPLRTVRRIRFEKPRLALEFQGGLPPRTGDRVSCDIVQSRRTGAIMLRDVRIVERNNEDCLDASQVVSTELGVGIVSDVVSSRNFGLISLYDEASSKREVIFFNLDSINGDSGRSIIQKGDEVKFKVVTRKGGKRTATDIVVLPRGTLKIPSKPANNACEGIILMEPSHSSLKNTSNRNGVSSTLGGTSPKRVREGNGRWSNVDLRSEGKETTKENGRILLIKDPSNQFGSSKQSFSSNESTDSDGGAVEVTNAKDSEVPLLGPWCKHLSYKLGAVAIHGAGATSGTEFASQGPRRGDLVSFVKTAHGKGARDIRVITKGAGKLIRGHLEQIVLDPDSADLGSAIFVSHLDTNETFRIKLIEVISCEVSVLHDKEPVEGLLHEGNIFGVCRTKDITLERKMGSSDKMRPRLNLTVKQGLGGKIMAQSMTSKGPDNCSVGFAKGWTSRVSKYTASESDSLSSTQQ